METVPVIELAGMTDAEKRAYIIADSTPGDGTVGHQPIVRDRGRDSSGTLGLKALALKSFLRDKAWDNAGTGASRAGCRKASWSWVPRAARRAGLPLPPREGPDLRSAAGGTGEPPVTSTHALRARLSKRNVLSPSTIRLRERSPAQ
jgi:hypothetical protein